MAKRIALKDHISINGVDISSLCRSIEFQSEHQEVDVSGFNATGADEVLPGNTVQTVTLEVFGSYGSGEIHSTLYPIHRNRSAVPFEWRPDQTVGVSATNPQLEGNVTILTYNPGATRGDAEAFQVTLKAADSAGLFFTNT